MQQYRVGMLEFHANYGDRNPWLVSLSAVFSGPDGKTLTVSGFYDGDDCWRIRFMPPVAGAWSYVTSSDLLELHEQSGSFMAAPAGGENPLYQHGGILRVAPTGRHLTYTDGTPFFWLGDTWWTCPSDHMPIDSSNRPGIPSMYKHLVELRRTQGFNVLHMAFLKDIRGVTALDFRKTLTDASFDVSFWQTVDAYFFHANDAGMIPALAMSWAEAYGDGALDEWCHLWGYLIARYGALGVTWLICGEYNIELHGEAPERVETIMQVARFIRKSDPYKRAMTAHPWWFLGDKHQAWEEPWYDFTMFQGAHLGVGKTVPAPVYLEAWDHVPVRPLIEAETNYEGILKDCPVDTASTRRSAYHSMQCGSAGFTYGAHGIWYPTQDENDMTFENWGKPTPWWIGMERPGATQMGIMRELYESAQWWRLEPWRDALKWDEAVCAQAGDATAAPGAKSGSSAGKVKDMTDPSVRGAVGPVCALVYFPTAHPVDATTTLQLPGGAVALKGTWVDLRTGAMADAEAIAVDARGVCVLPARPTGGEDWMLRLDEI